MWPEAGVPLPGPVLSSMSGVWTSGNPTFPPDWTFSEYLGMCCKPWTIESPHTHILVLPMNYATASSQ